MALAGLGRETNLLGSTVLADRLPRSRRDLGRAAAQAALVAAPFVLWALYVRSLYPDPRHSDFDNFALPLSGYLLRWESTLHDLQAEGWSSLARFSLASLVGLTTQVGYLAARWDWRNPWWRLGAIYAVLMATLDVPVWEGYPGASMRVLLPLAFAFNVLAVRSRWSWPLLVLGNLSVWQGLAEIEAPLLAGWR